MTPSEKQLVREFLTKVVEGDLSVVWDKGRGICFNLDRLVPCISAYGFVRFGSTGWRHHSGDPYFPICGSLTPSGNWFFGLWEGEQLRLRQSLCAHLLTKLEEQ